MTTPAYDDLLVKQILSALAFANGTEIQIYINPSDADKKTMLEEKTGITLTVSTIDFIGGTRAVIHEKNILIDHSFLTKMEEEKIYSHYKGGSPMDVMGKIYGINGPIIYLKGNLGFKMAEMVYVGKDKLVGEVIGLTKDKTTIQVYEETTGLKPNEEVYSTGSSLSVTLAPGILGNIFDGIERPLKEIANKAGAFIPRGVNVDSLDTEKMANSYYCKRR